MKCCEAPFSGEAGTFRANAFAAKGNRERGLGQAMRQAEQPDSRRGRSLPLKPRDVLTMARGTGSAAALWCFFRLEHAVQPHSEDSVLNLSKIQENTQRESRSSVFSPLILVRVMGALEDRVRGWVTPWTRCRPIDGATNAHALREI